jgi:hypothetical protein
MKMLKLLITLSLVSLMVPVHAACTYTINKDDVNVNWKAFKTPAKVGVGGRFRELGIPKVIKADSVEKIFNNTKFNIDSASTATRNSGRDAKIVKFFFQPMLGGLNITGGFKYVDEEEVTLIVKMNSVEVKVPMKLTDKDNILTGTGVLDLYDFSMKKNLLGINQACYELHEGKTWNDVEIGFIMKYSKKCE